MLLHFLALLFFTLDVNFPAQQLGRQADVLSLLANGQRELAVVHNHFQVFITGIDHCYPAYLGGLQCLFGKCYRVFMVFNYVNLLAAQLPNNGLHAHAFHAHTGAYRVYIFVSGHNGDFGALAGFAGNGPDLHGAVINFRDLSLEQVLHQFRRAARNNYCRAFGVLIHPRQDHAHAFAHGKRFQA